MGVRIQRLNFEIFPDFFEGHEDKSLLVFTVLAIVVLSTFAGVSVGRTGLADTTGDVLTGIELTSVHTFLTKVT